MPSGSSIDAKIARRFAPFAAVGFLALLAPLLSPRPEDWTFVWVATALTLAIAAAGFLAPWSELPRWTYVVPALAYFVVVALLREANDGSVPGYAPLALLPVVWIALNLGRAELALGIVCGAAVFVVPLLVGDQESSTSGDWRRALLWTAVATIIGFSVEALVREKRAQTRKAREHQRTIAAVADVARSLGLAGDSRAHICDAALDVVSGATVAAIWEPDPTGDLVLTGVAGPEPDRTRFHRSGESSGAARAFANGERYLVLDAVADVDHPEGEGRGPMASSVLFEPIVRAGTPVGVLSVGWSERVTVLDERTIQAVVLLALEAGVAIERADLVSRLSDMADTDELTGLPNRRAWDETIRAAVGYATRTRRRLCVALIDLDRFKEFNDLRGHLAGDRLLKGAAASWRTALRASDTLARYGGEEFAVALPNCSAAEAQIVLERLRALTPDEQTCSVGLAEWTLGETATEVVARADEALYEAKRGGRDVLVFVQ